MFFFLLCHDNLAFFSLEDRCSSLPSWPRKEYQGYSPLKKKKKSSREKNDQKQEEKKIFFLSFLSFLGVGRGEGIVAIAAPSVTLGLL